MIYTPTLLPLNWLELVKSYDISKINNKTSQSIASNLQKFILDKKENIIGARYVQKFLKAVIKENYEIFDDFIDIPTFIINEAFFEIRGELGLRFCEKFDSIIIELLAFQEVLKERNFTLIEKERAEGESDFFIKKHCLEYEVEVKFKMADQSFHNTITYLIMGYLMLLNSNCLIGKEVIIKIKLSPSEINQRNKPRVYKKVEDWCKSDLSDFSDNDLDITIENGTKNFLKITCGDNIRIGIVPEICEAHLILKSHMEKIQSQFKKRNPKRSIGIIMWSTPWNYDTEQIDVIEQNIKDGIQCALDSMGYVCDKLYIYPMKLKKPLLFKQKKEELT